MDFSGLVKFPELAQQSQPTHIYGTIPTLSALRNSVVPGKLFPPTAFMMRPDVIESNLTTPNV